LVRRRQALEVLSISALDIFASALGVFILISILMFPYYLKQPSLAIEQAGASAEMSAAGHAVIEAEQAFADSQDRKLSAAAAQEEALDRLRQAEVAAANSAHDLAQAEAKATSPAPRIERKSTGQQKVSLSITDLDLVFVMDTTGSMRDELQDLQANMVGVIRILHRLAASLRVGFVAFKDRKDAYVTRVFPLSQMNAAYFRRIVDFVKSIKAKGGGDVPEPVDVALETAVDMLWRAEAQGRIIVIGDATVHAANRTRTLELAERFRRSSAGSDWPRSVSTIFTGKGSTARAFFRNLAKAGGGDFSVHQGQMIESVLLSVLPDSKRGATTR
jgi:uncharacterized protein YukE